MSSDGYKTETWPTMPTINERGLYKYTNSIVEWFSNCSWFTSEPEEDPRLKWCRWWNSRARSIDAVLELARTFKPVAKAIQIAHRMFERRSDPRWGSARWKAKT